MKKIIKKNRKLTRAERAEKLCRLDKIELKLGRMVLNLIMGILGTILFLTIVGIFGTIFQWVREDNTRTLIYFIVCGIVLVRAFFKEF